MIKNILPIIHVALNEFLVNLGLILRILKLLVLIKIHWILLVYAGLIYWTVVLIRHLNHPSILGVVH